MNTQATSTHTPPVNGPSPVFTKTYTLMHWLTPVTCKFPREQRFASAHVLQTGLQTLLQHLLCAQRSQRPTRWLLLADVALAQLRQNWRLALDWSLITERQFEHGAKLMDEVGKLLGAWLKTAKSAPHSAKP